MFDGELWLEKTVLLMDFWCPLWKQKLLQNVVKFSYRVYMAMSTVEKKKENWIELVCTQCLDNSFVLLRQDNSIKYVLDMWKQNL